LSKEEQDLFAAVLLNNEAALAWVEDEKGGFDPRWIPAHKIPLVPHAPWQEKNHRMPARTRQQVMEFLKGKLRNGLYERSQSSYRSAFFPVEKKDKGIRIVHDLQKLNEVTIRDAGVPPNMDEMTESLAGCAIYTGLDAFAGYDQLSLHVDSRDVTTFESPLGTLRLTKMPQGWTNAVASYQRVMSYIFQEELPDVVQVYIDDVTVKGPKTKYCDSNGQPRVLKENPHIRKFVYEHACSLNVVLHKMKKFGGTFSAKKLFLGVPEIKMVGSVCSMEGRRVAKSAVAKLDKWESCRTRKEVRSILGLLGVARMWIPRFGDIVRPLVELTRHEEKTFVWTDKESKALATAKEAMKQCGVIRPINYDNIEKYPPILAIDASQIACGVELAQMDEQGRRRPARYMSIYYNEVQQRYSQPKLELYGIYVGMRAARQWVHGCKFILETDCSSVKQMINAPSFPSASEARWCWYIQTNHFELRHVPGYKHKTADALSRRPKQPDDSEEEDPEEYLDQRCGNVLAHPVVSTFEDDRAPYDDWDGSPVTMGKYLGDWKLIVDHLQSLSWPDEISVKERERISREAQKYLLLGGTLYRRSADLTKGIPVEVVLDPRRQESILNSLHEEGGHKGERGTYLRVRERFYWPGLGKTIGQHVKTCEECQHRDYRHYEGTRTNPEVPVLFGKWDIDCISMGSNPDGVSPQYIVIARDNLTGWAEAKALVSIKAQPVADFFFSQVIARYGVVARVTSDNGTEFLGEFKRLLVKYGIPQIRTSPYNPSANGVIERGNRSIKEAIFRRSRDHPERWFEYLEYALWADRTTVRRSTGETPYFLLYGQTCPLPIDWSENTLLIANWEAVASTEDLLEARMIQLERRVDELAKAKERVQKTRAQKCGPPQYQE
jgi:hypothetical protein